MKVIKAKFNYLFVQFPIIWVTRVVFARSYSRYLKKYVYQLGCHNFWIILVHIHIFILHFLTKNSLTEVYP